MKVHICKKKKKIAEIFCAIVTNLKKIPERETSGHPPVGAKVVVPKYCHYKNITDLLKVKVRDSGCKHTLFRPFSIVGPLQFSITND